jgi:hypothetical protein
MPKKHANVGNGEQYQVQKGKNVQGVVIGGARWR